VRLVLVGQRIAVALKEGYMVLWSEGQVGDRHAQAEGMHKGMEDIGPCTVAEHILQEGEGE